MVEFEVTPRQKDTSIIVWILSLIILGGLMLSLGFSTNIKDVVGEDPYLGYRYVAHLIVVAVVLIIGIVGWLSGRRTVEKTGIFKFE
ncbi:hypothetical protein IMZ38_00295 [Thermosphaera chiliense]|uniref:Cell division protein FtsW n=1 Tax=Thermosphaera chiliense TaxID=3402707 RepID=A0A7M1UQG6_9CREN|nr:hypothetical protein [Thermosphaera aggregans]QOR94441.1 hypothetical protein IMZ38_00295 [Thermosphaera aggregans]